MAWTARGSNPSEGEIFHTCPDRPWGTHSLQYNGYRVFPWVKSGRGVTLIHHPRLVPWSWKGKAVPLHHQWAVRPVQSLSACARVHFTFTLPLWQILVKLTTMNSYENSFSAFAVSIRNQTSQSYLCNFPYKSKINTNPTCYQNGIREPSPSLLKSFDLLVRHVDYAVTTSGCPHWLDNSSLSDCVAGVDFHSSECRFGDRCSRSTLAACWRRSLSVRSR